MMLASTIVPVFNLPERRQMRIDLLEQPHPQALEGT